jgi:hypothetical protein
LDCGKAIFNAGEMNRAPKFTFIIDILEFNNKISVLEGKTHEDT